MVLSKCSKVRDMACKFLLCSNFKWKQSSVNLDLIYIWIYNTIYYLLANFFVYLSPSMNYSLLFMRAQYCLFTFFFYICSCIYQEESCIFRNNITEEIKYFCLSFGIHLSYFRKNNSSNWNLDSERKYVVEIHRNNVSKC